MNSPGITSYHRIKKRIEKSEGRPIPTKWFFADHRIPRQIEQIEEEGECYLPSFFKIIAERWIPNYQDLYNYYHNWGKWRVNEE